CRRACPAPASHEQICPSCGAPCSKFHLVCGRSSGLLEVLRHLGGTKYLVDATSLVGCLIGAEAHVGRELEIDDVRNLAADVLAVSVQGGQHRGQILTTQRGHIDGGE